MMPFPLSWAPGPALGRVVGTTGLSLLAAFLLSVVVTPQAHAIRLGSAELFFSYNGDRAGSCVTVSEPADMAAWDDNVLSGSFLPEGTRWSHAGPMAGMRCTQIDEPADPHSPRSVINRN